MGLELYYHASQAPFTNVLFANVVGREDLSDIDMVGRRVDCFAGGHSSLATGLRAPSRPPGRQPKRPGTKLAKPRLVALLL
jgi:hypothetical protein